MPVMTAVSTMAFVHEKMHQWTGQDQQVWQDTKHMSPMLRQEEEAADEEETAGDKTGLGSPEACLRLPGILAVNSVMV